MNDNKFFLKSKSLHGNLISIFGPIFYGIFSSTSISGTNIIISKVDFVIMCCIIVFGGLYGLYGTLTRKTKIRFTPED